MKSIGKAIILIGRVPLITLFGIIFVTLTEIWLAYAYITLGNPGNLDIRFFIFAQMGFVGGILVFISGLFSLKEKRLIEDIPTSKIHSLAMGLVEVFGEVVPIQNKILKSPLTRSDCVYYAYIIQVLQGQGRDWKVLKSGESRDYFYLRDDTGMVLVDPKEASIDIAIDFNLELGPGKDPSKAVKEFLAAEKISFDGFSGKNKQMFLSESYIAPGDKLYILGTATDNPFVEEAWGKMGNKDTMIRKNEEGVAYNISDKSEKEVLSKLKTAVLKKIFGGGAVAIICLYITLKWFLGLV